MALKATQALASKLIPLLEDEEGTQASVSLAVMQESWAQYEAKAKYALIAQRYTWEGEKLAPYDKGANCAMLGVYSTEKQALTAGKSAAMAFKGQTAAMFWVVPTFWGTPFDWHRDTKERLEEEVEERVYPASPATEIPCESWFERGNALHICTLPQRHEGEHSVEAPINWDSNAPFTERRRLIQPDIDLEEGEGDDSDVSGPEA